MSNEIHIYIGPRDGDRTKYVFDYQKLMNVEAIAIEKVCKLTVGDLLVGMATKSLLAVTAVVWVLRKRNEPRLQFSDVEFSVGECELVDPDELEEEVEPEEPAAPKEPAKRAPRKRAAS